MLVGMSGDMYKELSDFILGRFLCFLIKEFVIGRFGHC